MNNIDLENLFGSGNLLYLAIVLVIIGWLWYFVQGRLVRKAWSKAADSLGLEFKNAFLLRNIKLWGQINGFYIEVSYIMDEHKTWDEHGRSGSERQYFTRFLVSHPDIQIGRPIVHQYDNLLAANGSMVYYPAHYIPHWIDNILNIHRHKFIIKPEKIINRIENMMSWGNELKNN